METKSQIETMYQSQGKALNGEPFVTVKKSRGYYEYLERAGVDSVAFILVKRQPYSKVGSSEGLEFCLINEEKPPMDERNGIQTQMISAFGGSIDSDNSKEEIVKQEVLEEAGYNVELDRIQLVGSTLVSTQMNQICHLFLVDVTSLDETQTPECATSEHENLVWLNADELMEINEWKSVYVLCNAIYQGII